MLRDALDAYPEARAVHIVRDGRDVVCSLLERGWLAAGRAGVDDADLPYGARARFWVEPGAWRSSSARATPLAPPGRGGSTRLGRPRGRGAYARDPLRGAAG